MSLPHTATANTIRLRPLPAVPPKDGEVCSDTPAIEETDAVSLRIGIGLTALAQNRGRFDLTIDCGGDGDGLEGVEGSLADALRF